MMGKVGSFCMKTSRGKEAIEEETTRTAGTTCLTELCRLHASIACCVSATLGPRAPVLHAVTARPPRHRCAAANTRQCRADGDGGRRGIQARIACDPERLSGEVCLRHRISWVGESKQAMQKTRFDEMRRSTRRRGTRQGLFDDHSFMTARTSQVAPLQGRGAPECPCDERGRRSGSRNGRLAGAARRGPLDCSTGSAAVPHPRQGGVVRGGHCLETHHGHVRALSGGGGCVVDHFPKLATAVQPRGFGGGRAGGGGVGTMAFSGTAYIRQSRMA